MKDIQNTPDSRGIPLQQVGVKGIKYPMKVSDKVNSFQHTIGSFNMYVDLTADFKGTHMSRFIEILNQYRHEIDVKNLDIILDEMKERLHAHVALLEITFPYFIEKLAPVSKSPSLMEYQCKFWGSKSDSSSKDFIMSVEVSVTTLCPCSKEISERGAHNQRSKVLVSVRSNVFVWLEDLIRVAEDSASCEIYPLLKRVDEKAVTEKAYDNPRFAEDLVREVALKLDDWSAIDWYAIECENFESIHGHNAYAFLKRNKRS